MAPARREQLVAWAVLAALVAWSAWERWQLLASSPFPLGVDGYFYPVQLRELLATGHLRYPATPLTFWLAAPLAAATDPVTGAKLAAAGFGALLALPAYGVGARLGGGRGLGLLAAVVATLSHGSMYLSVEFVKNGVGLAVALAALWAVLAALDRVDRLPTATAVAGERSEQLRTGDRRASRSSGGPDAVRASGRLPAWTGHELRVGLALVAVVAAALAHKMAIALVVAIAAPAAVADAIARGTLRGRRLLYACVALAVAIAVAAIAGVAAPHRFLSVTDLESIGGLLSSTAAWELPALDRPPLVMGHEALLGGALALIAGIGLVGSHRRAAWAAPPLPAGARVAAIAVVALALVIALPWLDVSDPQGLAMRLRVAAFLPMALCAALAGRAIAAALGLVFPALSAAYASWRDRAAGALAVALGVAVAVWPPDRTEGVVLTHPALASAVMSLDGLVAEGDTVVVPERHIAFMVAWYAGASVALRPEAVERDHRVRLLPRAFTGADSPLEHALDDARREPLLDPPVGLHARHPDGLVLVPEPTWEWVLTRLPAKVRARAEAWPTI